MRFLGAWIVYQSLTVRNCDLEAFPFGLSIQLFIMKLPCVIENPVTSMLWVLPEVVSFASHLQVGYY